MKKLYTLLLCFLSISYTTAQYVYPKRELRGAWIATVGNIDWPSSNNESSQKQIEELDSDLQKLKAAGINTVFFQVRTECDALYKSKCEPWSYWLTGQQGKAPNPFYDPLKAAIAGAHKLGLELHAWINPLRAEKPFDNYKISSDNIMIKHPDWILKFKDYKMLNPGLPAVRNYVASIVSDIVRRYDVDGIHFDDYFYPYSPKIKNEDRSTYLKYGGEFKDIDDWRRNNINLLIAQVNDSIKAIKPYVIFGISPFGIVENKFAGTSGFESYNTIYCDPISWIKNKSVDYIIPQLYWAIGNKPANYSKLLLWWASISDGVQLYIGTYSSKFSAPGHKGNPDEIEKQIRLNRQIIHVDGTVFFSAKSIIQNYSGLADSLKKYFKHPSLIPLQRRKNNHLPPAPLNVKAAKTDIGIKLVWSNPSLDSNNDRAFQFVIYRFKSLQSIDMNDGSHIIQIVPYNKTSFIDSSATTNNGQIVYIVTSVDRLGYESNPSTVIFRNSKENVR